jgi:hypothetical protein|tara:strand:+ start:6017 stop:6187 length:171 start_codon:yes stop_codon:yes gene_type:complete
MKSLNPNDVIDSIAKRIELKKQLRTTKGDDILVDESLKKEIAKIDKKLRAKPLAKL